MNLRPPLVPHGEPPEAIEPGKGAFHHPAVAAQPLARLDAATGNARDDAADPAGSATARVVVAFVGMQLGGTVTRAPATTMRLTDRRDGIQGRLQETRIMDIGCRERHGEGDSAGVDHKMALRPRFATIRWIRPGRFAPLLAATLAESSEARDQSSFSASANRWSSS